MKAAIIGYSGHAYAVIDTLLSNNYEVMAYCDKENVTNPYRLICLGMENDPNVLEQLKKYEVFLGLGNNSLRAKIFKNLITAGIYCQKAIHSKAYISAMATIDAASIVMAAAVINSKAEIGKAVICNSGSIIEHECSIADYAHIGPGAVLAGNVSVGEYTFVGANAVIKQGINIGSNVVIGAGAVITKDIESGLTVYGNPAKRR